ncbi:Las1-domain-containing protein [Auricularia subglabra TFB-10046 SS5]|nr:Las1-domain-containing protein [Auricularia subglabra TFB-10046 SS5]
MKLPRRVPWSSKAEVEQLCSWIYSEDAGTDGRRRAMARARPSRLLPLSAWHVATPLPHALDSVLSLLAAEIGDDSGSPALLVRQSYASAIVRFVNGMVDPLQFGAYARSIAAIAAQIGLPAWLVELRHAATHEDLPSLEILREAAREALAWLLQNYFLPVLSSSENTSRPPVQPSPLAPLLKEYKALAKQAARDESLRSSLQLEFTRVFRQLERWIGEAKVATSNVVSGAYDPESKEMLALELLANGLLDKGGLVPIAKKKRQLPEGRMSPPNAALWRPLLSHVQDQHPFFGSTLLSCVATRIGGSGEDDQDASVVSCMLAWVVWAVDHWGDAAGCSPQDTISHLLLNVQADAMSLHSELFAQLVETLLVNDEELKARVLAFLRPVGKKGQSWQESDVNVMKQRLDTLQQNVFDSSLSKEIGATASEVDTSAAPAPGWRLLTTGNWKPCPIGVSGY